MHTEGTRLSVSVTASLGVDVADIARDLCSLATRLNIMCSTVVNGTKLIAKPGGNPQDLWDEYRSPTRGNNTIVARPRPIGRAHDA